MHVKKLTQHFEHMACPHCCDDFNNESEQVSYESDDNF